ncbi:undecaprenyl/decaprenyl-phosphate alpha-N-acetylglucosaminyl 1-phosphate transferase [Patescibacteria group bacterium]|nr:undecaprenyl/decaprenyl-phosphate alpha-N-acetylglucosaminyl 1-phosphate transferase [Patescibacteria group bacterium]
MINWQRTTYRLKNRLKKTWQSLVESIKNKLVSYSLINLAIILFQYIYLDLRFEYINDVIPLWYTKMWGSYQLAPKDNIYIIPLVSIVITLLGLMILVLLNKYFVRYLHFVITSIAVMTNSLLTYSLLRIVFKASVPFPPLVAPQYLSLVVPFLVGFIACINLLPKFVDLARDLRLVTIPSLHSHPAMLLQSPSARGGGVFYGLLFLVLSIIFAGFHKIYLGFYLAILMLVILSLVDDYQNTHPRTEFRLIESPVLRLLFLFSVVSLVVLSGINFESIGVFSGAIGTFGGLLSLVITAVWIVWVLNVLSWSNGIDGQYCGIVSIASLIIAILALRFDPLEPVHKQVAVMAALSAGISLGFAKLTWHPSRIMWGFGATLAGLVISTLSILVSTKIVTSILIILVPLIDAVVTVFRRLLQGRSPFEGDKGHLHHILMEKGWSVGGIALFYWVSTALFGFIGLISADRYAAQVALLMAGVVAFFIILLNVQFYKKK